MSIKVIDDQPIAARFFNESRWLTEFITPNNLEVQEQTKLITAGLNNIEDKINACQIYVGQLKYKPFIKGSLNIGGQISTSEDLWCDPSTIIKTKVGNCANKSFLLTSMLRTFMPASDVHCVLGNLYNGHQSGHGWVQARFNDNNYLLEATRPDVPPILVIDAKRYEAVHLFNDQTVMAIEGRTVMTPFEACYSSWLKDYLDHEYIQEHSRGGG
jgi:hypothetical protein